METSDPIITPAKAPTTIADEEAGNWITCKDARELTQRGKTSIKNWIDSKELPTRKSEDDVTLVSKKHLLALHASKRKTKETTESQEPVAPAPTAHNSDAQEAIVPAKEEIGSGNNTIYTEEVCPVSNNAATGTSTEEPSRNETPIETDFTGLTEVVAVGQHSPAPVEKVVLSSICFDETTQIRERLLDNVAKEYAEKMQKGDKFPPVILFRDNDKLFIGDGWHRLRAAQLNNYHHFPAQVFPGGKPAAIRYALQANISHGLRLTSADKRKKVGIAFSEYPALSNNQIAEICGVSESLVRSIRDRFVKNEPAKRIGADGKEYAVRKKPRTEAKKEKMLFKKTTKLAQKLTIEALKQLKKIIEARLQSEA